MEDHIVRFLRFLNDERGLSSNTVAAYQNDLRQFVEYLRERPERANGNGNGHHGNGASAGPPGLVSRASASIAALGSSICSATMRRLTTSKSRPSR